MEINLFCHQIREPSGIVKSSPTQRAAAPPSYRPSSLPTHREGNSTNTKSKSNNAPELNFSIKKLSRSQTFPRTPPATHLQLMGLPPSQTLASAAASNGRRGAKPITSHLQSIHKIDTGPHVLETNRVSNAPLNGRPVFPAASQSAPHSPNGHPVMD